MICPHCVRHLVEITSRQQQIHRTLLDWPRSKNLKWPQLLIEGKPSPTGRFTFMSWRLWKEDQPLQESGLLGSVSVRTVTRLARN